jgi:lipoprotein NlpI
VNPPKGYGGVFLRACGLFVGLLLGYASVASGAEGPVDDLLNQAQAADLKGDRTNAMALVNQAIQRAPTNSQCYYVRGRLYSSRGDRTNALADFNRVLQMEPRAGQVYEYRGFEYFRLGRFNEAIVDFDKFLEYLPDHSPFFWQKGVACYFAGRFEEARKQFELHRLVNSNDVQNAAWHFACVARQSGVAQARASLFPNVNDRRVPMAQLFGLLQGRAKVDDVLLAARAGRPAPGELRMRLFHAHYYIGLYYEAVGESSLARPHIASAAEDYAPPIFMGDVARVHAALLRAEPASAR